MIYQIIDIGVCMLVSLNPGYSNPQFQRKPSAAEMNRYTKTLADGLKTLDKNVGLIIHNSSVPSLPDKNIGIGTLLSKCAAATFMPFLAANAVTSVQQDPDNIRGTYDPSPYSPMSTSKNIYMIPLERLASDEYGFMLSEKDLQKVIMANKKRYDSNTVDYQRVATDYDTLLSLAYKNFTENKGGDRVINRLHNEFEMYKTRNREEIEPKAVYEILAKKNNNEDWHNWNEEQRNLYISKNKTPLKNFITANEDAIDYYAFKQWLVEREVNNANRRNTLLNVNVIGDSPIAFTPVEVWMNQDLFMDGWALGCPPDYFSKDGQRWGFPVIKPETIFNKDGSLGRGGNLMRQHYEKLFETSPGGARIDHIIGLIDPFVYSTKEPKMNEQNSGRLYSSPNHPILGKYTKTSEKEYAAILEKIVFPAAAKYGLKKEDIICEDLGTLTAPVMNIMKNLNLTGIAITQYDYRGKDIPAKNVIMPGSHDNESFIEYTNNIFNDKSHLEDKAAKLAEDTAVPGENKDNYKNEIVSDKKKFISASFAELFTSPAKKVQIFFTTFFGMDKTYNKPGQTQGCWTLRLPEDFDNMYWENVKKGTAINLPEVIARAIRNKGSEFAAKHNSVLTRLDEYTKMLKD